jgi:hypothetical protein
VPESVDGGAQIHFRRITAGKELSRAQEAGHQEGGFDQVAAVVQF